MQNPLISDLNPLFIHLINFFLLIITDIMYWDVFKMQM